jgi:xanthine dehydrogenase YagS FAD-binding subunit
MPGSGCAAMLGYSRMHAILGASEHCIATYPGDMAVALTALDARIVLHGAQGERTVPIDQFYRPPGDTPQIENDLRPGELITAVELPKTWADKRSHYLKVRDRNSYAFALVSAAAVLDVGPDGRIRQARLALGSVAPKPWRDASAEDALRGQMADAQVFRRAAELLVRDARTRHDNAFKVELARRAMVRALTEASAAA